MFHENGRRVESIRSVWRTAVRGAGLPGLRPHGLRRSAIRNLISAGVTSKIAMDLTGHRTRQKHDDYNPTSTRDLRENVARLAGYLENTASTSTVTERSQRLR